MSIDLLKRVSEWLLGNSPRVSVIAVVLAFLVLAAPLLARGALRHAVLVAGVYLLVFSLVLVPLARVMGTYFAIRRVEFFLPLLLMLAAISLVEGGRQVAAAARQSHLAVPVTVVGVLIVSGLSVIATIRYYDTQKTNYDGVAELVANAGDDTVVMLGPFSEKWDPLIADFLEWEGVDREVVFFRPGIPGSDSLPSGTERVLWISGTEPDVEGLHPTALNDLDKLQIIAGDRTWGNVILPFYASESQPTDDAEFRAQRDAMAQIPLWTQAP